MAAAAVIQPQPALDPLLFPSHLEVPRVSTSSLPSIPSSNATTVVDPVAGLYTSYHNHHLSSPSLSPSGGSAVSTEKEDVDLLLAQYGRASHMGALDPSYGHFLSRQGDAALIFKVVNRTAVVSGDPLCEPGREDSLLAEFGRYCRKRHLGMAFVGAGEAMARYAWDRNWITMHFGEERVLNPLTNPVLQQKAGKRMLTQNRRLLDPKKDGLTVGIYTPAAGANQELEAEIAGIYTAWREDRNRRHADDLQAFVTVYDLFTRPGLMTYVYARAPDGRMNGFAALRTLGASGGFHIDPYIAAADAPRGVSDLLLVASMTVLARAGISYLSLGYEPLESLGEVTGLPKPLVSFIHGTYTHTMNSVRLDGKKAHHDKFRPDESQSSHLYVIIPNSIFMPLHSAAVMHVVNIKLWPLILLKLRELFPKSKPAAAPQIPSPASSSASSASSSASSASSAGSASSPSAPLPQQQEEQGEKETEKQKHQRQKEQQEQSQET